MTEPIEAKRDWIALLLPTVFAIVASLAIQTASIAWYFGNVNSRLNSAEDSIKELKTNAVTQHDITLRDTQTQIYQQEVNTHLNRMDDKLDLVLENQSNRKHGGQ